MTKRPVANITLGLPLAGKSTWIEANLEDPVVSADTIKEEHPDYDPENAHLLHEYSVTEAEDTVNLMIKNQKSFVFDSGSINNSYSKRIIQNLKGSGYWVRLVWIKTPLLVCLDRNEVRERKVPREDIIHKSHKERSQFAELSPMVDAVEIVPYFTNQNLFVDMDGVLAAYSTLPKIDGKIDFVNSKVFRYLKPVTPVIDGLIKAVEAGCRVRILSATPNSFSMIEKNAWLDEHFNIPQWDRYFVNSGKHKAEMLNNLVTYLKLDKKDVTMVDDNHDILYDVRELRMRPLHISSFLMESW